MSWLARPVSGKEAEHAFLNMPVGYESDILHHMGTRGLDIDEMDDGGIGAGILCVYVFSFRGRVLVRLKWVLSIVLLMFWSYWTVKRFEWTWNRKIIVEVTPKLNKILD